jgi:hypothetical protein
MKLKYLVIHCSDTPEGHWFDGEDIIRWHTSPKPLGRGWKHPGYADIIRLDGTIENIVKYNEDNWVEDSEITNGAKGYNRVSRHICIIGGQDIYRRHKDTRTELQKIALEDYVKQFKKLHPDAEIVGHYELNEHKPYCPGFNVDYLKNI